MAKDNNLLYFLLLIAGVVLVVFLLNKQRVGEGYEEMSEKLDRAADMAEDSTEEFVRCLAREGIEMEGFEYDEDDNTNTDVGEGNKEGYWHAGWRHWRYRPWRLRRWWVSPYFYGDGPYGYYVSWKGRPQKWFCSAPVSKDTVCPTGQTRTLFQSGEYRCCPYT